MKILIYSANYAPEPTGIGKYSGEMAEWLAKSGHEVRVVAAPPYYPAWRVLLEYQGRLFLHEKLHGVDVWRSPIWVPKRAGGLARVLHLLSFAITSAPVALWLAITWRPQVFITVAPFFTCAPVGVLGAWLAGGRSWLHVQDFEIDVAFGMGLLKGGLLKSVVMSIERLLFKRFDRVSSLSARMLERAAGKGVSAERLVYFRNWVDIDTVRPLDRPSAYRKELDLTPGSIVVLYSGSLGAKHGLQVIPEVARLSSAHRHLQFVICGDGPMKAELQRLCDGLTNVHFLPLQPVERLGELLNLADIHLLPQDIAAEDLVLPSKLSGMLGSGRPVVATCAVRSEMASVVTGRGCVVQPGDATALASEIARLAEDPDERHRLGQAARAYAVAHLGRDGVLGKLERDLWQVVGQPSGVTSRP